MAPEVRSNVRAMKPELEFFDSTTINLSPLMADDPNVKSVKRILSLDMETRDETSILYHPSSDEWGRLEEGREGYSGVRHDYWEEVFILQGKLWDGNTGKWYGAGSYCCRPPGMFHGPFKADPIEGCAELVFSRHDRGPTKSPIANGDTGNNDV